MAKKAKNFNNPAKCYLPVIIFNGWFGRELKEYINSTNENKPGEKTH
jgi:hypothetical protein